MFAPFNQGLNLTRLRPNETFQRLIRVHVEAEWSRLFRTFCHIKPAETQMPETNERRAWSFGGAGLSPESRVANAAEYIAYYLDRIEQHLANVNQTLTADPADGFTVLSALKDVGEAAKA